MLKIFVLPGDQDPMPLSRHLWQAKIGHRVLPDEATGGHAFWLLSAEQLPACRDALDAWQRGDVQSQKTAGHPSGGWLFFRQRPATLILMATAIVVTLAFEWLVGPLVFFLVSFTPMLVEGRELVSQPLSATLSSGQWWRLITPIFLHFGWMHLVFNLLWTWVLGEKMERHQGSLRLVLLVVFAALVSNAAQFLVNGSSQFGGLSGVIYAYLGYTWLWDRRHPGQQLGLTPGMMGFMLGWMLFGMTPWSQSLGINMANEAHLGGLLAGLAFAFLPWPSSGTANTRKTSL
ncbi:rhomboid family intramembrane serine protease [Marinospirillum sp.]|uniref:rhomboid family intramembrane serine protease n=1 Tax=Marinospirillum sp. TaxID=2183934 RepID=UPI00384DF876